MQITASLAICNDTWRHADMSRHKLSADANANLAGPKFRTTICEHLPDFRLAVHTAPYTDGADIGCSSSKQCMVPSCAVTWGAQLPPFTLDRTSELA